MIDDAGSLGRERRTRRGGDDALLMAELNDGALVVLAALAIGVLFVAYRLTFVPKKKRFQKTVEEVEESTPLLQNEAQLYINKLRKEMGAAGIQLGGEFEHKLAQAHMKAKRDQVAQNSSTVRQRAGRDPRTA